MSLHSIKDLNALDDPLKQYQITFLISTMRGSSGLGGILSGGMGDKAADSNELELRCTSFTYPGTKIATTKTVIYNHVRTRAAMQNKSGQWSTTVIEGQSGQVLTAIQNWCDLINNPLTGISTPSTLYTSLALLKIQSPNGHKKQIYLHGLYPVEIKPITINPSASEAVQVEITWNYDWYSEQKLLGL